MSERSRSLKGQQRAYSVLTHAALLALSALFILPLIWMIGTSLKAADEVLKAPPTFLPKDWLIGNYPEAFSYNADALGYLPFLVYARNTLVLCLLVVSGAVLSNSIVAYAFARLRWPGRDIAFGLTLATMMVPFPVLMVPLFGLFRDFGWIGTFKPIWVPAWFGAAFSIFLLRQFFRTIPFELTEAAKLDGCSEWGIFSRIVLPLSKPALIVVGLFSFLSTWNDFLGPLIYLTHQHTFTLSLGLQFYQSQQGGTQWHLLMAASAMVVAPVILLFFFAQRYFIKGISMTGIKG